MTRYDGKKIRLPIRRGIGSDAERLSQHRRNLAVRRQRDHGIAAVDSRYDRGREAGVELKRGIFV